MTVLVESVEEAVRSLGVGREGAERVMIVAVSLVLEAVEGQALPEIAPQHAALVRRLAVGDAGAAEARAELIASGIIRDPEEVDVPGKPSLPPSSKRAEGDPLKLSRSSDQKKVLLYLLLAFGSEPPADQNGRWPIEGYAISCLEALLRVRQRGSLTSQQLEARRYEFMGKIRAAGQLKAPSAKLTPAAIAAEEQAAEIKRLKAEREALAAERAEFERQKAAAAAEHGKALDYAPADPAPAAPAPASEADAPKPKGSKKS